MAKQTEFHENNVQEVVKQCGRIWSSTIERVTFVDDRARQHYMKIYFAKEFSKVQSLHSRTKKVDTSAGPTIDVEAKYLITVLKRSMCTSLGEWIQRTVQMNVMDCPDWIWRNGWRCLLAEDADSQWKCYCDWSDLQGCKIRSKHFFLILVWPRHTFALASYIKSGVPQTTMRIFRNGDLNKKSVRPERIESPYTNNNDNWHQIKPADRGRTCKPSDYWQSGRFDYSHNLLDRTNKIKVAPASPI